MTAAIETTEAGTTTREIYNRMGAMKRNELIAFVRDSKFPTSDAIAEALWHLLSGNKGPYNFVHATEIYTELGYKPFAGFPLQRHN